MIMNELFTSSSMHGLRRAEAGMAQQYLSIFDCITAKQYVENSAYNLSTYAQ